MQSKTSLLLTRYSAPLGCVVVIACWIWRLTAELRDAAFPALLSMMAMILFLACMLKAANDRRAHADPSRTEAGTDRRRVVMLVAAVVLLIPLTLLAERDLHATAQDRRLVSDAGAVVAGPGGLVVCLASPRRRRTA